MHIVTLTQFASDDAIGCLISEPLDWLAKLGVRNTVLAVRPIHRCGTRSDNFVDSGERIVYLSLPGAVGTPMEGAFLFAHIVGRIRKLHRTEPVDLLHAHNPLPCGHAAMLLSRELNIPYIVTVHGHDDLSAAQVSGRRGSWCHRITRRVFADSRRVVCVSEHLREEVLERMGRGFRTSVAYGGVDEELFSPVPEPSEPTTTVLSAGRLRAIEGHDVLIRTTAALVQEFPSLALEVVGDGPERSRLEKVTKKLGLAERVRFVGRHAQRQFVDMMKRCMFFALPSGAEQSACLHMQAMSCGKAVIGCRGQGIAEIVQQGASGFLVGPGNEKELTIAMGMLLREPQRRRNLGTAARDVILERFTAKQHAENLKRIYRESLA